ncbi:NAD(+) synthase [Olsenella uli]|uniref:NAD(+) synthase n=1 Tax=Olsenella uli TaxID=133926 RepID=UPI0012AC532F|nr:NAD(+) synthase [Olsenella uli]
MRDGFVKVAALTPAIRVADVDYNVDACVAAAREAAGEGARVIVLPELAITAYTCEDLFWQDALLDAAARGLACLVRETAALDALLLVGVPLRVNGKLYNCAAVASRGQLLGLVPKRNIPTYNEFYEGRHFLAGPDEAAWLSLASLGLGELAGTGPDGDVVPFGSRLLFACDELPGLVVGAEICEDLWVPDPPSTALAQAGATLVCNLSASNELVGKADYRRSLVASTSARLVCAYMYASAGWGESTQDLVFGGHDLVCENGRVLAETKPLADAGLARVGEGHAAVGVSAAIDVQLLAADRRRMSTFETLSSPDDHGFTVVPFSLGVSETSLAGRLVDPHPFVPADRARRSERCEEIFAIQAHGLAKRLAHTHSARAVVGVSGGLDSTLALLVCARAFDLLGLDRAGILAITMPGFGTTARTHDNARAMSEALGCELREISIAAAVRQHFADIGHDEADHSVTFENAQARERTQILMDVANQEGGLVVGTGDLSELALGWATYNADHMSMYGVNAGVPKTLVRHLVRYVADAAAAGGKAALGAGLGEEAVRNGAELARVLYDVLDTPVSPELLPATGDGKISQKTEDLVGPYELHDFFLYNVLRCGFGPAKVYRLALEAFGGRYASGTDADDAAVGTYDAEAVMKWLRKFYWRFFSQQFKRSCLPDGPKVGTVAVSPRGDLRMPSDAVCALWQRELEGL